MAPPSSSPQYPPPHYPHPLVCADMGNSAIKLALYQPNHGIVATTSMAHRNLLEDPDHLPWPQWASPPTTSHPWLALASVTNAAQTQSWKEAICERYGIARDSCHTVTPYGHPLVTLHPYNPAQLGADRFANLLTAITCRPNQPTIICDVGTATTIDWIDDDGQFLGGVILPGPMTLSAGLQQATARLPRVSIQWQTQFPGDSTQHCIQAGLSTGYVGMVEANLARGPFAINPNHPLILTGGGSEKLHQLLQAAGSELLPHIHMAPNWTIEGIIADCMAMHRPLPSAMSAATSGASS